MLGKPRLGPVEYSRRDKTVAALVAAALAALVGGLLWAILTGMLPT